MDSGLLREADIRRKSSFADDLNVSSSHPGVRLQRIENKFENIYFANAVTGSVAPTKI
jgi:hypothetical protein